MHCAFLFITFNEVVNVVIPLGAKHAFVAITEGC